MFSKLEGMTHQTSFAQAEFAAKKKITRREKFLTRMEEVIPWARLLAVIEPFYPKGERGRPPIGLERMLRVYFLQQWYGPSDVLDHATSEIAIGSKLGIDATKKIPGEGFKRPWPPLIKMDEAVRKKMNSLFGNAGDKF